MAEVEYKKASNAVRDATRNYQTVFWDKVGDEIAEAYRRGPGFFYEAIKRDLGIKTTSVGSGVVGDDMSLGNAAVHFNKLLNPQESDADATARREVARQMINRIDGCSWAGAEKLTAIITLEELEKGLAKCENDKAMGIDTIPAEFVKGRGMAKTREMVVGMMNQMLNAGEVDALLKDTIMVPLYKETERGVTHTTTGG